MKKIITIIILSFSFILLFNIGNERAYAKVTVDYADYYGETYNLAIKEKVIVKSKVSFAEFKNKCNREIAPSYRQFVKEGGNLSFEEFADETGFGYPPVLPKKIDTIDHKTITDPSYQHYKLTKKRLRGYHMKAGDILICYGTNSLNRLGKGLGHAAIAYSSSRIVQMPGPMLGKHDARTISKRNFFKAHSYHHLVKTAYVIVYRILKHPKYARAGARYAYWHEYRHDNPNYRPDFGTSHKNPSYCSKFVYLAYNRGNHEHHMKQHRGWVFPHTLVKVFTGKTYHPTAIHKIV